jgi:hypothetical protein
MRAAPAPARRIVAAMKAQVTRAFWIPVRITIHE